MEAPQFQKKSYLRRQHYSLDTVKSYANDATKHIEKLEAVIQGGNVTIGDLNDEITRLRGQVQHLQSQVVTPIPTSKRRQRKQPPLEAARQDILQALLQLKSTKCLYSQQQIKAAVALVAIDGLDNAFRRIHEFEISRWQDLTKRQLKRWVTSAKTLKQKPGPKISPEFEAAVLGKVMYTCSCKVVNGSIESSPKKKVLFSILYNQSILQDVIHEVKEIWQVL